MLAYKQTELLSYLARYAITDIKIEGNRVNMVRGDGETFSFVVPNVNDYKGDKGDKGPKGDKGDSAYDIAKTEGFTGNIKEWLASLKGPKGDKGEQGLPGIDGKDGVPGNVPTIKLGNVSYSSDITQSIATLEQKDNGYTLSLTLLKGQQGDQGISGDTISAAAGTVTWLKHTEAPWATIKYDNGTYTINLGIPKGAPGDNGKDSVGLTAFAPSLKLETVAVDHDKNPGIWFEGDSKLGEPWTKTFTLYIPRGETGDKGDRGPQGDDRHTDSEAIFKVVSDINEIDDPGQGFCVISIQNFNNDTAFGWSWRTPSITQQIIWLETKSNVFQRQYWYRQGTGTGKLTDVWRDADDFVLSNSTYAT